MRFFYNLPSCATLPCRCLADVAAASERAQLRQLGVRLLCQHLACWSCAGCCMLMAVRPMFDEKLCLVPGRCKAQESLLVVRELYADQGTVKAGMKM